MKLIFSLLAILGSGLSAQAQTRTKTTAPATYSFASPTLHEIVISPSRFTVESYDEGKDRTDITIYAAYNHHLKDNIQIGGEGGTLPTTDSNGASKGLIAAMGVFTYNFDANLREAYFVQGGVGLYPAYEKPETPLDTADYESKISFFGGIGKRFEMWGKINYMPYIRAWKRGDENARYELQAFNFSIFY